MAKYILETERCILRPPTLEDLDDWVKKLFADPDVTRYVPNRHLTPREDAERAFNESEIMWTNYGYGGWAIIDKDDGQIFGRCGLTYHEDTGDVELGYGLARTYWGKGIATEVARACVRFGFEVVKLPQITAVVVPENIASWGVLERLGFVFKKEGIYHDQNVVYYAIRRKQFQYGDSFYDARPFAPKT
ncbi:MAG: GNAT family N-acetyltransferase [Chloroflexi bacterium]|nr:GNAT family N-acetyltransferase [Chloroflexota bacterium]